MTRPEQSSGHGPGSHLLPSGRLTYAPGVFRFRLYQPDGSDVGVFETLVPNWQPGEAIVTDDGRRWFILGRIAETEPEMPFGGYLEGEPLGQLSAAPAG